MKRDLLMNLFSAGLNTVIGQKALDAGYNLTKLRTATKADLDKVFYPNEVKEIRDCLQRAEIDENVIKELVEKCNWSCCVCWKYDELLPVILHHIEEHSQGGKDTYENLVVLCLNHHGYAHSKWEISRSPLPPEKIRELKAAFEKAIAEFKAGKRPAPGREGDGKDSASKSDFQALKDIAGFCNRPAFWRHFDREGSMDDFLQAMTDVLRTLNTGVMKTREGDEIGRTKDNRQFSNPHWQERMVVFAGQIDSIIEWLQIAMRDNEVQVLPSGWYHFRPGSTLPDEMDLLRQTAAMGLNKVLEEAGIPPIRGPRR